MVHPVLTPFIYIPKQYPKSTPRVALRVKMIRGKIKLMKFPLAILLSVVLWMIPTQALAIVDPLTVPNNRFGIHLITETVDESSPAAQLVNSSGGDWGYITVLAESKDRDHGKWQAFFDDLRHRHLIPLVRLATAAEGQHWKKPYEGEEQAWADFFDGLVWPTKNRYIIIYNEPNQGQEWQGVVDPADYARTLDRTITTFKTKNEDFFVLNAGLDASAPQKPPAYFDEERFLLEMNQAVPGIFNRLDGWNSHSYPNPNFAGSPDATGRGTVRTWFWELQFLRGLGVTKNLPVFITETGWKHSEGLAFDRSVPDADTVATYYQKAFEEAWNNSRIVAVTPFLLNYQQAPFDHFSFKKLTGQPQNDRILGVESDPYYPQYKTLLGLAKTAGLPLQDNKAELTRGTIFSSIVSGESYKMELTFKNTGQSVWNERGPLTLRATQGASELGVEITQPDPNKKIDRGQETTFILNMKAPLSGTFAFQLQLFNGDKSFNQQPLSYEIKIKSPVALTVDASLRWKADPSGQYTLTVSSPYINNASSIVLDSQGKSPEFEDRYLVPDQEFDFTLQRPYYKSKTIHTSVGSGINHLQFGELEPDLLLALMIPGKLWELLPWSQTN